MWSVTKCSVMQLPKPAVEQSKHEKCNSDDKNYQSTRCFSFKKKCPMRPMCDDKNCQSANIMRDLNLKELIFISYAVSTKN